MLPFNHVLIAIFIGVFGLLLLVLVILRRPINDKSYISTEDPTTGGLKRVPNPAKKKQYLLWICEILAIIALIIVVSVSLALQWDYIPKNTPGCVAFLSPFGVIASAVDPSAFAVSKDKFPAFSYADAIIVYQKSPNGLATGYFAWDGVSVTILNSNAHQLISGAPRGNSWVFQDLNTAVPR